MSQRVAVAFIKAPSVVEMPFGFTGLAGVRDSFGPTGGTGSAALGFNGSGDPEPWHSRRIALSTL